MTARDPDTIEAIARWLEQQARYGDNWQRDRLADQLRSGEWTSMPEQWTDQEILHRRASRKADVGLDLTPAERQVLGLVP